MYGKAQKKKPEESINTLNCSSMDTWNTGSSLRKPSNSWENGFNAFGNFQNLDPRASTSAIPNTSAIPSNSNPQFVQQYMMMQCMQYMQMNAAAMQGMSSTNPLGLNPLENLSAIPSTAMPYQMAGMPPGRPRSQQPEQASGSSSTGRKQYTKASMTYGEYKKAQQQQNGIGSPVGFGDSADWDNEPQKKRQHVPNNKRSAGDDWNDDPRKRNNHVKVSNNVNEEDWDDEEVKPIQPKKQVMESDDWDDDIPNISHTPSAPIVPKVPVMEDDWDDEPIPVIKMKNDFQDIPGPSKERHRNETVTSNGRSRSNDEWNDNMTSTSSSRRHQESRNDWNDHQMPPNKRQRNDREMSDRRSNDDHRRENHSKSSRYNEKRYSGSRSKHSASRSSSGSSERVTLSRRDERDDKYSKHSRRMDTVREHSKWDLDDQPRSSNDRRHKRHESVSGHDDGKDSKPINTEMNQEEWRELIKEKLNLNDQESWDD